MADYRIRPSRRLRAALIGLHGLAGAALFMADLAWPARIAGLAWLVVSLVLVARPGQVRTLRCRDDGSLAWVDESGETALALKREPLVLPCLCVLHLAGEDGGRRVPILGDSLPTEEFRRLRVWLRWRARK